MSLLLLTLIDKDRLQQQSKADIRTKSEMGMTDAGTHLQEINLRDFQEKTIIAKENARGHHLGNLHIRLAEFRQTLLVVRLLQCNLKE